MYNYFLIPSIIMLVAYLFGVVCLARPRRLWLQALALVVLILSTNAISYYSLGHPRKPHTTLRGQVLASYFIPNQGIYILLRNNDNVVPFYAQLPWSQETAKKLQEAEERAKKQNGSIEMTPGDESNKEGQQQQQQQNPMDKSRTGEGAFRSQVPFMKRFMKDVKRFTNLNKSFSFKDTEKYNFNVEQPPVVPQKKRSSFNVM